MATSNDLLSYSIMTQHKPSPLAAHRQVSLPPLDPIIKQFSPATTTTTAAAAYAYNHPVRLPPLARLSNYTTADPQPSHLKLTEHNLHHLEAARSHQPLNGLGLLSATIASMAQHEHTPAPASEPKTASSWTSGSSAASTPMSSPSMSNSALADKDDKSPKRRQRLGPSCDSCRSRKVKCNAVITIVQKTLDPSVPAQYPRTLSADQIERLARGDAVREGDDAHVIVSNSKLIRFKSCKSCNVKGLACCFSKGFTKEDIMLNNKKSFGATSYTFAAVPSTAASLDASASPVSASVQPAAFPSHDGSVPASRKKVHKVAKKKDELPTKRSLSSLTSALSKTLSESHDGHTRKSSCVSCRRRKVKCVFNFELNKCEGCNKKSTECVFEKR